MPLQTFVLNSRWTFAYGGQTSGAFIRYGLTYAIGYGLNLTALLVLVDVMGYRHELVQAIMTLVVAATIFTLQKLWVFRRPAEPRFSP